jgi:hypothetical protein
MLTIYKRTLPLVALLLFIVACSNANPTASPTEQIIPSPVMPIVVHPTATSLPSQVPTSVPSAIPTISTPLPPLGGSGVLVFGSNRNGDYTNIYMLDTTTGDVTQLTNNDSNTFPGPFSPVMA